MKYIKKIIFLLVLLISIFYFYLILTDITMDIDAKEAAKLRDELHNLDIHFDIHNTYYRDKLYYIIASGEGFSSKAYRDTNKKLTIGYGFNMDRGNNSRKEWDFVFHGSINFDKAKEGEVEISKEQARMLQKFGVMEREKELDKIYAPYWREMRLNERAIVTDLYYQSPKLAGKGTKFCHNLKEYYRTGNVDYLANAVTEVKERSSYAKNPRTRRGLQNRNNIRAIILDSRECILYSNPHDDLIPKSQLILVTPGETMISRETSAKFPEMEFGAYYIWRTCMDDKVRPEHQEREGKVFHTDDDISHPGQDYGCRCYSQPLPINAKIIHQDTESHSSSDQIIRAYIANLSEINGFCIR